MIQLGGALVVGVALGLLGSGGSIITVPILVHGLDRPFDVAVSESLWIVGLISLVGAIVALRGANVQFRTAIIVAPFGVAGAFLGSVLTSSISNNYQEGLFLSVLLASSFMMLKSPNIVEPNRFSSLNSVLLPGAFFIGVLSGLVGVGGGFLILPLLIYFGGLKFNDAAGTSLLLITSQSLAGAITPQLLLPIQERPELSWGLIFWFTIIGIIGLVFGDRLRSVLTERVLRKSFGFALMILTVFLVSR